MRKVGGQQDGPQRSSLLRIHNAMGSERLDIRKIKCPLCPGKYLTNGGFVIHCDHKHPDYQRIFDFTGAFEDKLKCVNCHRKFSFPVEFHGHLDSGLECIKSPINEESMPLLKSDRRCAAAAGTAGDKLKRKTNVSTRRSPAPKTDDVPSSISAKPPPRTRKRTQIAKRASSAKSKSLAKAIKEEQDRMDFNKRIGTTKRRRGLSVSTDENEAQPPPAEEHKPHKYNKVDNKGLHPHGITPSLKNVRKGRFRKTLKTKVRKGNVPCVCFKGWM
jgi:hypothetical protein